MVYISIILTFAVFSAMEGGLRADRLFFLYVVWFAKHFILVLAATAVGF